MLSFATHPDHGFTYLISEGETTVEEWLDTVNAYRLKGLTDRELYDLREQKNLFSNKEIGEILEVAVKNRALHTSRRRTALLVATPSQFGLSRMYELKSEIEGVLTKTRVFYRVDEAIEWLGSDVAALVPELRSATIASTQTISGLIQS